MAVLGLIGIDAMVSAVEQPHDEEDPAWSPCGSGCEIDCGGCSRGRGDRTDNIRLLIHTALEAAGMVNAWVCQGTRAGPGTLAAMTMKHLGSAAGECWITGEFFLNENEVLDYPWRQVVANRQRIVNDCPTADRL